MIGRTLAHYRILEQVGAGGMGVVYRAHDEHLDRDVALKVLPDGVLASAEAVRRFRREALVLSRLNHPGIAVVHDFDSQDGILFLVMEYVTGATLADMLLKGPLDAQEALTLGVQIAQALEAAHEQGVVHRDLKPGNIVCTSRGNAKVLDFGIAKLLRASPQPQMTQSSTGTETVLGTVAYMAPEQLLGKRVDARSDLYSFGVVLYEMATGRRPFEESSPFALANAILNSPPPPPRTARSGFSSRLEAITLRCLEKDPDSRYLSARELLEDLALAGTEAPGVVGTATAPTRTRTKRITSLAVLPLENLSGDSGQEYFADGLTEALIVDLAQIGELRVISRGSAMRYKGTRKSPLDIATELKVDAVVEGSVIRAGDRVRVTAQLIEPASERHLWARSYDRDLVDILATQSDVAQAIADQIQANLTPELTARLGRSRRVNPEAYDAYLRGRHHWNKRSTEGLMKSLEFFRTAIEKDLEYAPAHAGLAGVYAVLGQHRLPPRETFAKARAAAMRALELDDADSDAHAFLAMTMASEWDWPGADRAFRRSVELNPGNATAHHWYSIFLVGMSRFEEAIAEIDRALELDPLSLVMSDNRGWILLLARRNEEAIEQCEKTVDMDDNFALAHAHLGWLHMEGGRFDRATTEALRAVALEPASVFYLTHLGCVYARSGRRADAEKIYDDLVPRSPQNYVAANFMANLCCALGEKDKAFMWLEKACEDHNLWLMHLPVEPAMDSLRGDPRFEAILKRVGLAA